MDVDMSDPTAVSVVIATRNRPESLLRTLDQLAALRPAPPVIVVDNASTAGGPGYLDQVRRHPAVRQLMTLDRNRAAYARTLGAREAPTRYVAFSDDDSWWDPDAFPNAVAALDAHPRLALVAARTVVGPGRRPDPLNHVMADSPLPSTSDLPGRPVLGALACASVLRREAFLEVGGFRELFGIGGEETLLCYDLAAAGWGLRYLDDVVAVHHPAESRQPAWRREAVQRRNRVLVAWMRRPVPVASSLTWQLLGDAAGDRSARAAVSGLARRLPTALARRRRLPESVERDLRRLEQGSAAAPVRR